MLGNRASNRPWQKTRRVGKPHRLRFLASTNAAMLLVGYRWPCGKKATGWAANACARPCAAGACTRYSPKLSPRARPIRPIACVAPPTGCSTSPNPPKQTTCGSATLPICRWPLVLGLFVRLAGRLQQARGRLACDGLHARGASHHHLATRVFGPTAHA